MSGDDVIRRRRTASSAVEPRSRLEAPLVIDWFDPQPALVTERLAQLGLAADAAGTIRLGSAILRTRGTDGPSRLVIAAAGRPSTHQIAAKPAVRLLALGVATVDAERFLADHPELDAAPAADDEHLGARAWRGSGSPRVLVLEPATEGLLTATLARLGEVPVAIYLGGVARTVAGRTAPGPLGPAVLLPGGPAAGPHVLVVEAGGTISR
jgi:hypothetical protein